MNPNPLEASLAEISANQKFLDRLLASANRVVAEQQLAHQWDLDLLSEAWRQADAAGPDKRWLAGAISSRMDYIRSR